MMSSTCATVCIRVYRYTGYGYTSLHKYYNVPISSKHFYNHPIDVNDTTYTNNYARARN